MIALLLALSAVSATGPTASVTFVARGRVYFDRGRADGLQVGTAVQLLRRRRASPLCAIDGVSDHHATCADPGQRARVKDRVLIAGLTRPQPAALDTRTATIGPGIVTDAPLTLGAQPFDKVDRERAWSRAASSRSITAGVALGYGFHSYRVEDTSYGAAEAEAWFAHLPLGFADLEAALHVRARARPTRSATARFRPDVPAELYVLDASLSSRPSAGGYTFALGRVGSHRIVGLRIFDGGVVGVRVAEDQVELGAFLGLLPDAIDLVPSTDRYTGGVYARARHAFDVGLLSYEARVAVLRSPTTPVFVDGELAVSLDLGSALLLHGGGRAGYQTGDQGGPRFLHASGELVTRPAGGPLELTVSFRERRDSQLPDAELDAVGGIAQGTWQLADTRHLWTDASWTVSPELIVSARAGYLAVLDPSALDRVFVGPEVELPQLFGAAGGLHLGYQESLGWITGRAGYAQSALHPLEGLDLLARVGVSFDRDALRDLSRGELDVYVHLAIGLTSWLDLRLAGAMHGTLFDSGGEPLSPGFLAQGTLVGTL